jgi:trans-aconitate methyltransferase
MKFEWNPDLYDNNHDFVHKFGGELVSLLTPRNHETILDLGCGTGDLTQKISTSCKEVIGLDNSIDMIQVAESKYKEISFFHKDAKDFKLNRLFDAVFSSSVLHWITEPEIVIKNINSHLKTGGRIVAEFGGKGCVNNIISALTDILDSKKVIYPPIEDSLYYPSISQYTELLELNGFEVRLAILFDRPTELKGGLDGLKNFIEMFFIWLFDNVSSQDRLDYVALVENRLKNELLHNSTWIADYRRIRILALKVNDC